MPKIASYDDWQPAAERSRSRKAISDPFDYIVPGEARVLKVAIVKPLHGDPVLVYNYSPGIKVRNAKITSRDVDKIRKWKSF